MLRQRKRTTPFLFTTRHAWAVLPINQALTWPTIFVWHVQYYTFQRYPRSIFNAIRLRYGAAGAAVFMFWVLVWGRTKQSFPESMIGLAVERLWTGLMLCWYNSGVREHLSGLEGLAGDASQELNYLTISTMLPGSIIFTASFTQQPGQWSPDSTSSISAKDATPDCARGWQSCVKEQLVQGHSSCLSVSLENPYTFLDDKDRAVCSYSPK